MQLKSILATTLAACAFIAYASVMASAETVVDVYPGDDLDAKANAAGPGDTIQVHGDGSALYVYAMDHPVTLEDGQILTGDIGTTTSLGPANVPDVSVGIKGASGTTQTTMLKAADGARVEWLDLDATNTQKAINGLPGGPTFVMQHVVVHGAPASGIGQYRGSVLDSEVYGNGTDPTHFDGTVAGIKCNYACEVSHSYIHDNPGNGAWCDVGCQTEVGHPEGFYVHDNVVGDNGRHGIFYENSPKPSVNWGDTTVKGLIQNNVVYGNSKSGISVSDSAYGTVDSNTLGLRLDGTADHNAGTAKLGIEMHSSGDTSRGIQHDALIENNIMHTETIDGTGTDRDGSPNSGCGDNGNVCTNNVDEPTVTPPPTGCQG